LILLRFADDIALIAENKEYLAQLIKTMDEIFNMELDMRINVKKTKVLVYGRENRTRIQIKIRLLMYNRIIILLSNNITSR